ncbi:MAG TPA: polyprenyl synthetase family protein, partial [Ignisphaera sp.]|nr:polyprenyl synthetase family protein [Ignisphaera sp.]
MKVLEYARYIAKKVDDFMLETIKGTPEVLYQASLHYIKAGGKRLRPLLTILASRIAGGEEDIAIPGAAAIEVLHTFTLIHDDIIDKDELRRGVPTV